MPDFHHNLMVAQIAIIAGRHKINYRPAFRRTETQFTDRRCYAPGGRLADCRQFVVFSDYRILQQRIFVSPQCGLVLTLPRLVF